MKAKRSFALFLALLLTVCLACPALAEGEEGAAAESQSIVVDYTVTVPDGRLTKGATAVIAVKVRNPLLLTADGKNIDVTRTADSFKGGSVSVAVTSADDKPLEYTVTFTDVQYTGKGNSLNSFVLYRDCDLPVEPLNVTVEECVEVTEPQTDPKPLPVPDIQINRDELAPVGVGERFQVTVRFSNASAAAANAAVAVFEPGEGLTLEESKTSKPVGTLGADASAAVTVALRAADPIAASPLTLGVTLQYTYAAAAGETFDLTISFLNTSKTTAVDNIVMTVDAGESLAITSASNTYYFPLLKPGETKTQKIEMQVPTNAAVTSAKAEIAFRYEYVTGGERTAANTGESLSVPVYLPDRFSITPPEPITAMQGSEVNLSVPYVNRGKGEISNVEAKLAFAAGSDATCEQPDQLLGNIEAGKSGTIDFFFTPNTVGELKFTVTVSYEDEMTEAKTVSLPLTVTVEEAAEQEEFMPDDEGMEDAGDHTTAKRILIAAAIAVPLLAAVVVVIVIRLKKKKRAVDALPADFDWGDGAAKEQEPNE